MKGKGWIVAMDFALCALNATPWHHTFRVCAYVDDGAWPDDGWSLLGFWAVSYFR